MHEKNVKSVKFCKTLCRVSIFCNVQFKLNWSWAF